MILLTNAAICLAIAIRLFLYQRGQSNYKLSYALLAWGLVCSSAAVAILIFFNQLSQAQTAQTFMNLLVFICMFKTKGNISQFIYHLFWQSKATAPRQNKKVKIL
ncbi:hypothetical protein GCM10023211_21440 [Orbus sasakiae]|uniref:Phage holin family protein n=1 Tax=Orbus sasakiae TaxID=1078475 RepID=A0ABP9NAS1_9GAMM